ncbi:MAG: toxin-antitoxin system YwqK family antitoxin [Micrococcales bacterium]
MSTGSPFYENGLPRFKGKYKAGKMHGPWEFYRKDGSLMRSGSFDQDRQVGIWKTFARDGGLVKETDFGK